MRKKVIVVNYTGRKGGGAIYAYEMTKSLVENGCCVYAVISKDIENLRKWEELPLQELMLITTYSNKLNYVINTIRFMTVGILVLKRKFKNINIDAVYIPMIQPWSGLINSAFKESQKIITVHDPKPHSGSNSHYNKICKKVSSEADDIIILSETFREYSAQYYNKEKKNIHVIPHGIFDYYRGVGGSESTIKYDENKINFLFFGRITKYKGLHILSKAYERLSKEFDNVTLTVVGNGNFDEYREEYSQLKNVTVVNRWINDDEVGRFFEGKNIVTVLPYVDASQSGVIPIAMEYESLVIASNTGGLSEQIKDKETGYLFETYNENDLYKTMKFIVEHYVEQGPVIQKAVEYIRSLSWGVLGATLTNIIHLNSSNLYDDNKKII